MNRDAPIITVSEDTPVQGRIRTFLAIAGVVAAGALAWGFTTNTVSNHAKRIDSLEAEARASREVLIRIDERTADIRRQLERPPR